MIFLAYCALSVCLFVALVFALDYLARTPRSKPRKPRNIGRMPWVDVGGLHNQQARGMGFNPRGKR